MDFRMNYLVTEKMGDNLLKETEQLEENLKHMLSLIERLNIYWHGNDYDEFSKNEVAYIKNINFKVKELKYLGNFIKIASKSYSESDYEWLTKIRKIGADQEWGIK